jgi:putative transposase
MTAYRRHYVPGGSYFFTVNLEDRSKKLLTENIDILREAVRVVREEHPFNLVAMAVLPDHLHAIWTLPPGDADFSVRWRKIKAGFSRRLGKGEVISASRASKGERGIWQRRFWEHMLRDEDDFRRHMDYLHFNPVKHGHCAQVKDWPFSTFHRCVKDGIYTEDWAGDFGGPELPIPE